MTLYDLFSKISVPIAFFIVIGLVLAIAGAVILKSVLRLHDHFNRRWAYTNKEGRLIQIFSLRRAIKTPARLSKCLQWFGLRVINNNEIVSLLEDNDCPMNVLGYDSISHEWLKTVYGPGGSKTLERFERYPEILPEVTLIGVTKINASLRVGPIKIPREQAAAQ